MKLIKSQIILAVTAFAAMLCSCSLDNYDAPDSALYGVVIDPGTGAQVLQELIEGSEIDVTELDYSDAGKNIRKLNFKTDGSFRDNNYFKGRYAISATRTNFSPIKDTIEIDGDTYYEISALPYIRIKEASYDYAYESGIITFKFKLETTVPQKVLSADVSVDQNMHVGWNMRNSGSKSITINSYVDADQTFTIGMPTLTLGDGEYYYFRIGALIDLPEAKRNYSEVFKIRIDKSQYVPDQDKGVLLDGCESLDGWSGGNPVTLDTAEKMKGEASLSTTGGAVVLFQKKFKSGFNTGVNEENGHFQFWLYVGSLDFDNAAGGEIEITSSGESDKSEYNWQFSSLNLSPGWNKVDLRISDAVKNGSGQDLSNINFVRLYQAGATAKHIFKIDDLRFYKDGE